MTPNKVYDKYLLKVEKNSTNDNFSTSKGQFAELYNELSVRVIKFFLNNRNLDNLKDIQVLLVNDLPIVPENSEEGFQLFPLPKDFFSWSFARAKANKGECKEQDISLFEIRDEDRANIINNTLYSPSFRYREAPYNFTENFLKVYTESGMDITKLFLSYYRYPNKITLQNPDNPESDFEQVELKLPEHVIDRIISAMVGDFKISNADPSFEVEKFRQNENIN